VMKRRGLTLYPWSTADWHDLPADPK
jgi:hypothetical protein